MTTLYTTKQGEMLDAICWRLFNATSGYVEQVLDLNPRLAELPPILPIGTIVTLPDLPRMPAERKIVSLWS
jgi:phage tail protein X